MVVRSWNNSASSIYENMHLALKRKGEGGIQKLWIWPNILGVFVVATTIGEPWVEYSIPAHILVIGRVWIPIQGNIELWVPLVLP